MCACAQYARSRARRRTRRSLGARGKREDRASATSIAETSLTIEGHSGRGRFRTAPLCRSSSRRRHEHMVTTNVSQGRGRSTTTDAPDAERGPRYRLWSGGRRTSLAPAIRSGTPSRRSRHIGLELSEGRRQMPEPLWRDPPPAAPLRRPVNCSGSSRQSICRARHARMENAGKAWAHPRMAHMLVKAREHGAPRWACDIAAI